MLEILKSEKRFILKLLKKYKTDKNNTAIWQMKWELIHKNFKKIKELENNDKDNLRELEKKLEL